MKMRRETSPPRARTRPCNLYAKLRPRRFMFSADEFVARQTALSEELGEPITVDGLTSTFRIFQRKKGHRHSTDDLLTAWYALEKSPPVSRALDLGTGIGTVGLLVLAGMPGEMKLTCIEAQDVSYR